VRFFPPVSALHIHRVGLSGDFWAETGDELGDFFFLLGYHSQAQSAAFLVAFYR